MFKPMYGKDNPAKRPEVREKLSQSALKRYAHKDRREPARNSLYTNYRKSAELRGHEFLLTREDFASLTSGDCYYCGNKPMQTRFNGRKQSTSRSVYIYNGIDRVDNEDGYHLENCVSCCPMCNKMKRAYDVDVFIKHAIQIAEKWGGK